MSRAVEPALLLDHRAVRRFDIAAALIAALFVALGVLVAVQLWALSRLSASLFDASSALDQAGRGLSMVRVLPLIGDEIARLADSIQATATSVHAEAVRVRSNIRVLAVVVGVAVALVGLVPLALIYLPFRILRMRALAKLAGRLDGPADPMLVEQLAWCALARLPFEELRQITRSPGGTSPKAAISSSPRPSCAGSVSGRPKTGQPPARGLRSIPGAEPPWRAEGPGRTATRPLWCGGAGSCSRAWPGSCTP
ncbi:hypothetical protein ACFQ0O_11260 [Saccharopolyspora spinosporotrichia]